MIFNFANPLQPMGDFPLGKEHKDQVLFDSRAWNSLTTASCHWIDFIAWEKDLGSWFSMILVRKHDVNDSNEIEKNNL